MITYTTQPWRSYCITAVTTPCTVTAVTAEGKRVTLVVINSPGQAIVDAPDRTIEIDKDDAIITPSFRRASLGSSAGGGVNEFYVTVDPDGTRRTHNNSMVSNGDSLFYSSGDVFVGEESFSSLVSAVSMFYSSKIRKFSVKLPVLVNGSQMFRGASLEYFDADMPLLQTASMMFANGPVFVSFSSNASKLKTAQQLFANNTKLESVTSSFAALVDGYGLCYKCTNLHIFSNGLPVLSSGTDAFRDCKLSAETINTILTSLPAVTGSHTITFTGCPGAASCDKAIGTTKGWTVQV